MPWIKLDDRRATHRKLRQAGFAARGLDEAAMCQVSFDGTDGFISSEAVETLALAHREKQWRKLVAALVQVGRWEETDGGWIIHDYLEYNPSAAENEERQRHLSEVRSAAGRRGGQASGQARRQPQNEARREANGKQLASSKPEANGKLASEAPSRPVPLEAAAAASSKTSGGGVFEQAVEILVTRQLARVQSRGPRQIHAQAVRTGKLKDHADEAAHAIAEYPDMTPEQLADWLEPTSSPHRALDVQATPLDQTRAADEARMSRAEQPACPTCGTRGGNGWLETDNAVARCPDCTPARSHT